MQMGALDKFEVEEVDHFDDATITEATNLENLEIRHHFTRTIYKSIKKNELKYIFHIFKGFSAPFRF